MVTRSSATKNERFDGLHVFSIKGKNCFKCVIYVLSLVINVNLKPLSLPVILISV